MREMAFASRVDYYDSAGTLSTSSSAVLQAPALEARSALTQNWKKLLIVMVGMPARGKSFIAHKLVSFLSWSGRPTRVFNVGQHRRATSSDSIRSENSEASFFDANNVQAKALRESLAMEVLDSVFSWFESGGEIAIFDATNSTKERRSGIAERVPLNVTIVFLESVCDDRDVIEANMRIKVAASPDFRGLDPETALEDLRQRIANYERVYKTVEDDEGHPYIKVYNFSSKVTANLCFGRLSKTIVPYLMAVHTDDRPVYLTALAPANAEPEAEDNVDVNAVNAGYGARLKEWWYGQYRSSCSLSDSDRGHSRLLVITSTLQPAVDAAKLIRDERPDLVNILNTSALNPLLLGERQRKCIVEDDDILIRRSFSERLDGGESYADLVNRLESCILDLEASVDPVLIITHATPARALRAYFMNIPVAECMGAATSAQTQALANRQPAVLEIRGKIGGGWGEKIHML